MQKAALGASGMAFSGAASRAFAAEPKRVDSGCLETIRIPTSYYQNFDADLDAAVPEESFGGWKKANLDFPKRRTALVVMHAWDMGTKEKYPGWWRAAPWARRASVILENVFPGLLNSVRMSGIRVFHVASAGNGYYERYAGYQVTKALCRPLDVQMEKIPSDPITDKILKFRSENVFVGSRNEDDVKTGFAGLDFPTNAKPLENEPIAVDSHQLLALCKKYDINHLIYCGFCINWCLLLSPGGMADMNQHGIICSAIRDAVCAVENKETAATELAKEIALWRVALAYGFVFDSRDITSSVSTK